MPKISELPAETTPADGDLLPIVDIAGVITKKITRDDFLTGTPLPNDTVATASIANAAITPVKWTNPYKFRVYRSAAYNTVSNTITVLPFDTENFDSNNNFTSNTYTAPVAGFYQFNARIGLGPVTNIAFLVLYKNGSEISRGNALQYTTNPMGLVFSDMIQLAQGDTIDVRYSINGAVAINVGTSETFFSGYLISQT